ncbi:MAG: glycosyl hydrolase family 28-related protein [Acidobacteriaceae bacterium]
MPFATVNEITTVGSIWPLAPYAKSVSQIGSGSSDAQTFDAAAATVEELVGVSDGTAPGPMLPMGYVAPMAKLYSLANIIANCVQSSGGVAGDGSPCGELFSDATAAGVAAPSDTASAALAIAQNPGRNVVEIFDLSPASGANQPALSSPPTDWTLPILAVPATPTILPDTSTLMPGQTISIEEDTSGAAVYYTTDGSPPSGTSQPYSGPIILTNSATVSAVAIKASVSSSIASRLYTLAVSVALTPLSVTLAPAQTQLFNANVANTPNAAVTWTLNPALGNISNGGLYTAPTSIGNAQSVQVTATSAADPTKSASATILLTPGVTAPVLSISPPPSLSFSATQGSSANFTQSVIVGNTGSATTTLNWSVTATEPWLTFSPVSGSIAGGGSQSVAITANPTGLGIGIHNATVTFSVGNGTASPQYLAATLTVNSIIAGYPVLNVERTFPGDTGMINVKTQYGAKGDGVTDDTRAIQQAISGSIHSANGAILYFPAGVYLVSSPLVYKDITQTWSSALTLQGENQDNTIIKLADNDQLYQNSSSQTDVLDLGSQNTFGNGAGNDAFDNYLFDITIDVGRGNKSAVALDFMGNNYCGLRNVTLKSSDPNHAGAIGLSMLRYATGPCLMKNVVINGFDYGIDAANMEYSATFENLTLLNQGLYGIYNSNNVLSIRGLVSTNRVPAIYNQSSLGLITLLQATLQGGSPAVSAIVNSGTLYARNVNSAGYSSVLSSTTRTFGSSLTEYDSGQVQSLFPSNVSSLNLPIQETPQFEDVNLADWANVVSFGADPKGSSDSSAAIQTAIDSGATTVYFPTGKYLVTRTIFVRGSVRMIAGFDSYITPPGSAFQSASSPSPLFQIDAGASDVTLNHLQLGNWGPYQYPGIVFIEQNSARPVALLDSAYLSGGAAEAVGYQNTTSGAGALFVEDVSAGPWNILTPQNVFARQINPEVNETKILNNSGHLWILGLKTEQGGTNIETDNGGYTELLGGLLYPAQNVPSGQSAFVVNNSRTSLIYAVSNYSVPSKTSYADFQTQVTETQNGVTDVLPTASLPTRGYGIMMPLYIDTK